MEMAHYGCGLEVNLAGTSWAHHAQQYICRLGWRIPHQRHGTVVSFQILSDIARLLEKG